MLKDNLSSEASASHTSIGRNRTFQLILLGSIISVLGDGFHSIALSIWILTTTGSAAAMSAVIATRVIVAVLAGPICGTLGDRSDRRRLMWATDLFRGLMSLLVVWVVSTPGSPFWAVLVITATMAVANQLRMPAASASMVHIVGKAHVEQAGALLQMSNTIAQVLGPMLGGVIVATAGGEAALLLDALSFWMSAACVLLAPPFPSLIGDKERLPFWKDLRAGFHYMRQNRLAAGVLLFAPCMNLLGMAAFQMFPVLVVKQWQSGPFEFGLAEAAMPIGFTIGSVVALTLGKRIRHRGLWIVGSPVLAGPLIALIGLMPSVLAALPVMILPGIILAVSNVLLIAALQTEVDPEVQGRAFGTLTSLVHVGTPLGIGVAGILADRYGPTPIILTAGLSMGVIGLLSGIGLRDLRQYR